MIEKPAEQAGLILEPGLVEILVRDADGRTLRCCLTPCVRCGHAVRAAS